MDIQSRKIKFVQEFLKIQSEELIAKLKKKEKTNTYQQNFEPMTVQEFNERVDKSETDFTNGKFKSSKDLLDKYQPFLTLDKIL